MTRLFLLGFAVLPVFAQQLPDVSLSITVRQKEGGRLSKGYHIMRLDCFQQRCSMTTVTLNQCMGPVFAPIMERTSTDEGTLRVSSNGNVLDIEEKSRDGAGSGTGRYRVTYVRESGGGAKITKWSGAYVKNSSVLGQVISTAYVPLADPINVEELACPGVALLGLNASSSVMR